MSNHVVGKAVLGCGNISDQYLTNLVRFPDVNVLACADLDLDRAAAHAAKCGVPHSADLTTVWRCEKCGYRGRKFVDGTELLVADYLDPLSFSSI